MIYFSYYTRDRSGAQILNILYNYYYCFKNNFKYAGAIKKNNEKYSNNILYTLAILETKKLIKFLNIPSIKNNNEFEIINSQPDVFNKEFLELLHNSCKPNLINIKRKENDFIVCLHVRRGDIDENGRWSFRYTKDEYYFSLIYEIKKYKPNAKIYLFSEKSFYTEKNLYKYRYLGCILKLDTSLKEAFNYFIQCDIFIMASSAFSIVPALYKKHGLIIYTWNKYFTPLKNWISENDIEVKKNAIKNYCLEKNNDN